MDILPTILTAIGENPANYPAIIGKNLLPYINGETEDTPHDFLFWWLNKQWAVNDASWKLVYNNGFSRPKLFNIANDISELNDLYETNPEQVERLTAKYDEWKSQQMDAQWGWNPIVGNYVAHFSENFENIVKRYFGPMGNGVTTGIIENPKKEGINKSNTVLKVIRPDENAQDWSGAFTDVTQFQRKLRYMHVKILKSKISVIRAKLRGKNMELQVSSTNAQTKTGEWEDFVFDFNNFSGPVNKINIQPDLEVGEKHEIYIDDLYFDNNPNPVSAITGSSFFNKNEIRIYPNPATNYLHMNCNSQVIDEVSIVDVSGKIILKEKQFKSKRINIASVNPGIYFLNIIVNNNSKTHSFIKI